MFFCEYMYIFLLGKYLGMVLLVTMYEYFYLFWIILNCFIPIYRSTRRISDFHLFLVALFSWYFLLVLCIWYATVSLKAIPWHQWYQEHVHMFNYSLDFLFFLKCLPPGFCPIWRLVVVVLSPVTDLSALLNVHIVTIFSHLVAFLFSLLSLSSDKCTQLILMWERIGNVSLAKQGIYKTCNYDYWY